MCEDGIKSIFDYNIEFQTNHSFKRNMMETILSQLIKVSWIINQQIEKINILFLVLLNKKIIKAYRIMNTNLGYYVNIESKTI